MVGITRIATYVPRRRLDRAVVGQTWGTRVAPGRRSVAGLDEDPLTMAVDAVLACLDDADPAGFDALYFASTSSPYLEKQVASVVATATDLPRATAVADFCGSVRAGVAALRTALDGVRGGSLRDALVAAADARLAEPESELEPLLGDGAAAVAVGRDGVIAELISSASVAEEFTYFWRTDEQRTVQVAEPRFGASYGYARDVAEAVTAALRKAELPPASVAGLAPSSSAPRTRCAPAGRARLPIASHMPCRCPRTGASSRRGASCRPRRRASRSPASSSGRSSRRTFGFTAAAARPAGSCSIPRRASASAARRAT
ncbi:MAG: hydroxymethylglutaryl-CoA synthase family protein, partial [Deltaproteobacteria bacterium]